MSEPDAYAALHGAIVSGELSPGERLIEEELAEQLGLSRGAVRNAILRLGHEGLVVRERNRGARVRRFSPEEAIEILEARAALESLAAGYAALRHTKDEARELQVLVKDMAKLLRSGELLAISERNAVLHRRILEISRHQVALDICSRLHSQVVRFQYRTVLAPGRSQKSLTEHQKLVAAIVSGNRSAAEHAMRKHLTNVATTLADVARPSTL